jgi:xylulokinase
MADARRCVIGIDVGTTAAKGGLFDCDGGVIAEASRLYPMSRRQADYVEQDSDDWLRAVEAILVELSGQADPSRIASIGLCSQVNTNVFVDRTGNPVLPAIVWQDCRAAGEAAELDGQISDEDRLAWWGGPFGIDASHTLSRMLWVKRNLPKAWEATAAVLSPKDYCLMKLTGSVATDMFSSFGLVDQRGDYIPGLLALVDGAAERLPKLRLPLEVVGLLTSAALPDLKIPSIAGTMDAWAGLFGAGAFAHGRGIYSSGTSEIIALVSRETCTTSGIVTFPPWEGLFVHAGPTQSGGDSLRWFADLVDRPVDEVLSRAAACDRSTGRVGFLPHLQGERAPLWDPFARGTFIGLTTDTGLGDLALAVLEGVGYSARLLFEAAEQAANNAYRYLLFCGGGARSDLWAQIRADILGVALHRLNFPNVGSLGAAILAGIGAGLFASAEEATDRMVKVDRIFTPDPALTEHYRLGFHKYRQAYEALKPVYRHG